MPKPKAYLQGDHDGYEAAKDAELEWKDYPPEDRDPLDPIAAGSLEAEAWISGLINAVETKELARLLGVRRVYVNGYPTERADKAMTDYNLGCTAGWNRRVKELSQPSRRPKRS